MTNILYIQASPRPEAKSTAIADAYIAALREQDPNIAVDVLDLAAERLPEFDGNKVAAKMAVIGDQDQNARQKTAWDEIISIAQRFIAADQYVLAVPMWNGGIPYRLKQYIDVIHQPGLLWTLDATTGYHGLLKNKSAVLALTSGAWGPSMPSPAFGIDHHSTYLKAWLNQAGVDIIREIRFQPTIINSDPEGSFKAAVAEAQELAMGIGVY
ncbi:FMN-dependent NADH-azoreductase [Caenimonas soli]|uniref:FMN-dependent NADH-azoreductase n=1 Tax=Caenimonas soli TaxID=2735555 RepID=UPI0015527CCD|nr:NAD(P)H-dependent oxidoreductase [Caenimonas soli]NPC58516.1 FMN-dependent NADH-azoreductase [Caenimonas soli]